MHISIVYDNLTARIEQLLPNDMIVWLCQQLRYHPDGYKHLYKFKSGNWDGYEYLFDIKNQSFRRGLLDRVCDSLKYAGHDVMTKYVGNQSKLVDHHLVDGIIKPYEFQRKAVESTKSSDIGIIVSPTGCHAKGQQILMYDGSIKLVEDIVVGDNLMGPDSKPRRVISLAHGNDTMVKIMPVKGEPFVVNMDHILTLQKTNEGKSSGYADDIVDVSVREYLNWPKYKKHVYKLFRCGVEFEHSNNLPLDPYFIGLALGDGSIKRGVAITTADHDIIGAYVRTYAETFGLKIRSYAKPGSKASTYHIHGNDTIGNNKILNAIKQIGLFGTDVSNKHIPYIYKTSSVHARLELLAGLIDSDGHLSTGVYDYISKSKSLANDVAYVARSLGLAAYISTCNKSSQYGTVGLYYRVCISGDICKIPVKLPRKMATTRKQKKSVLRTGFSVELLDKDDYYGFSLTGDGRFLLGDFTVTHNTGKTIIIALMLEQLKRISMVLVTDVVLLDQMQQALQRYFNQPIGIIGDGEFDLQNITVSTIQSLQTIKRAKSIAAAQKRINLISYLSTVGAVVSDEAHLYDSEQVADVMSLFLSADRFYGMSATPYGWAEKQERRENMELEQHFGKVVCDTRKNNFIDLGLKVPIYVQINNRDPINTKYNKHFKKNRFTGWESVPDPAANYRDCLETEILKNERYHDEVAQYVNGLVASGNSAFVHAIHNLEFGESLHKRIPGSMLVTGKTKRKVRREIYDAMRKKEILAVISDVGGTGLDIPSLNAMVLASDTQDIRQLVGRVARSHKSKDYGLVVDYKTDTSFLLKHSNARHSQYQADGHIILG